MIHNETGKTAKVWLALAKAGRMSPKELTDAVPAIDPDYVGVVLRKMTESGMVVRFDRASYGVTTQCKPARGVTVQQIMDAVYAQ